MKGSLLLFNLKLNCLIFFYQSKQLTDYIYTDIYCVNYRNALDRLCVRMNVILFLQSLAVLHTSRMNCDKMAGDSIRQFVNRNCYRLSRIS